MYICMASGGHLKMPIFLFVRDQQLTASENGGVRLILHYTYIICIHSIYYSRRRYSNNNNNRSQQYNII